MNDQHKKHILIAEKIEGLCAHVWRWDDSNPDDDEYTVGKICSKCGQRAWGLNYSVNGKPDAPDYLDLNLCARAEAKIAEMGKASKYELHLCVAIAASIDAFKHPLNVEEARIALVLGSIRHIDFAFAPASSRVDAMCALIAEMEAGK